MSEEITSIVINSEKPAIYTAFKLANPLRIVIDISDADISSVKTPVLVENDTVKEIRMTQFDEDDVNIGRIEILLEQITGYKIEKDGNKLSVLVDNYAAAYDATQEDMNAEALESIEPGPEIEAEAKVAAPEKAYPPAKVINDFSVIKEDGAVAVVVTGDGAIGNYNAFRLGKPARVVVDIFNVKNLYKKDKIKVDASLLKAIRVGQHKGKVRLVLDSRNNKASDYFIVKRGKSLVISLGKKGVLDKADLSPAIAPSPALPAREDPGERGFVVTDLKFTQLPEASRIIVSVTGKVNYSITKKSPEQVLLNLPNTAIPKGLQRSLDTSEFNSPVSLISSYQEKVGREKRTRIVFKLNKEAKYIAEQDDGTIFVDFERDASTDGDDVQVVKQVLPERKLIEEEAPSLQTKVAEVEKIDEPQLLPGVTAPERDEPLIKDEEVPFESKSLKVKPLSKVYTGQRVSLDYKDADIGNVLRLFAEVSGFNVIAADDVKGTVTIKLSDVPWDQAFDIVLNAKGLGMVQVGNVIRVAPADKLKKEEAETLTSKKDREKLVELDSEIIPVSHAPVSEMAAKIKEILTDRGSVTVDDRSSLLIIRDIRRTIEEAKLLVKELDKPTPQVLIEARIVEVDTNYKKELGVQWGSQYAVDAAHGNALNYQFPNSVGVGIGAGGGTVLNAPVGSGFTGTGVTGGSAGGAIGISFGSIDNTISLDLKLSALESKGVSKIISRPRVVTINKKQASIEQGLSIPFETTSAEGTQTTFVDASLKLTVTPEVKQDKSIILTIKASKNEPDFARAGAGGAPSIAKKEAQTEVLIKDGDTTVIGGIFTQKKGNSEAGVPFLSKLPLIGWMFKTMTNNDDRAELLIFVTPRIIEKAL
ncbi:MAG: type IV pilus secretin PilQ [Deltaproteobacteria bacterium]|nr:type IV pilus secretin PilQ [Deltaproteobacteria bacterium]